MAASSKKVILAALIGNSLIAVTKFVAATVTGSSAMLSEGIHSLVDTGNQGLLLHGLRRAKKPPDEQYPFGHGKEIYFWSFVVTILIFSVGAGISIYEGILHLAHPEPMQKYWISYLVLGIAIVFESGSCYVAFREFQKVKGDLGYLQAVRRGKDPSMFVVLFEDSAAMAGLLVAFTGTALSQLTGIAEFDGAASVLIGVILALTAVWLAYETKSLLIGESAGREVVEGIRRKAGELEQVERVNEVLTLHMGPEFILVNLSVDVRDGVLASDLEAAVERLSRDLKQAWPAVKRVFVEAEAPRRPGAAAGAGPGA